MSLGVVVLLAALVGDLHAQVNPFQPQYAKYNETEARMLVNLAAGAYGTDANRRDCISRTFQSNENQQIISTFSELCDLLGNKCEGYAIVSSLRSQLTFVFRGTKTNSQLLLEGWTTLQPTKDFYGLGNVNGYFANGHERLWPTILQVLNDPRFVNYNVFFTGHSLGAALAALAAVRTVSQGVRRGDQVKLVTFGEPRVGNLQFARNFDNIISYSYRLVHRQDIVPHLPACEKDSSYMADNGSRPCSATSFDKAYHHGTEVWYPDSMIRGSSYTVCTGIPRNEDFNCSDKERFNLNETSELIYDHRHYFNLEVPDFGKTGCDPALPQGQNPNQKGILDNAASLFSKISNSIGIRKK